MTGSVVPSGADCVIMVEDTELLPSGKVRFRGTSTKVNIAFKAEDLKKGDVVLSTGKLIKPQDIAVMAAIGHVSVKVARRPEIGVISTGSELVEPQEVPGISKIRNSNSWQLMAQIRKCNVSGKYYGIVRDEKDETLAIVNQAIAESDIVLISGGVSMGDFDFVPSVLEEAGVRILFTRVAVQPGKPTTFGLHKKAAIFGLPGNPVSSFMQFELLVKPLIFKMMKNNWHQLSFPLPMKESYSRRSAERMAIIPVIITDDKQVLPVDYHGSAHISAISGSDGIISMVAGKKIFEKGEIVNVRQI
jgi:molybdopterin molybdotransferase